MAGCDQNILLVILGTVILDTLGFSTLGLKKFVTAEKILVLGLDVRALAHCCAGVSVAIG
jgi:hypothetical protein